MKQNDWFDPFFVLENLSEEDKLIKKNAALNPELYNDLDLKTLQFILNGKMNKQLIVQKTYPKRILQVISLSRKVLVLQDLSGKNWQYHYEPL